MKIKKLKLINFKNFVEETVFDFQDMNLVLGKNGEGKTAIKDAVTFCFYNRTSEGSLSNSDKFISLGKMKCLVECVFENSKGEHTIRRERTSKQTRITYVDNSQSEEDSQISQESLNSMLPSFKNFSSVFNIGWFMGMADRDKRNFILKLTPEIDKKLLFEQLGGKEEDIEKFCLYFDGIEYTHKSLLASKLSNEKSIEVMRLFNTESKEIEIAKTEAIDKSDELSKLKKEKEQAIHIAYSNKEYKRIEKHNSEVDEKNKEIEKRILEIKVLDIKMPNQDKINSLIAKKNEYSKKIEIPDKTCPTCLQVISSQHKNKISKINSENIKLLEEVSKVLLSEQRLYEKNVAKWEKNEEEKKKKLMLETQFDDPLPLTDKPVEEIVFDESTFEKLEKEQLEFIKELNTIKLLTQQEEERKNKICVNNEKIAHLSQENDKLKKLINIFSPKGIPAEEMNMKLDPLKKKFEEFIPKADIVTLEPLKNEMGVKEVFKITIDEKDYLKLSLGEKTRIDIAISKIINSMLEEKVNMFFLDNSEILDSSISLPSQSFICKVTNQPLKIN